MRRKRDELRKLRQMETFSQVPRNDPERYQGAVVVGTRWVMVKKGTEDKPKIKARLCAQEFALRPDAELFAGTPGLPGVKTLLSHLASAPPGELELWVADVKGAFLYGRITRHAYIRLPKELDSMGLTLGKLNKSLYGLRDAPQIWKRTLGRELSRMGLEECPSVPGMWRSLPARVAIGVHVDDDCERAQEKV